LIVGLSAVDHHPHHADMTYIYLSLIGHIQKWLGLQIDVIFVRDEKVVPNSYI
jgi:hypothetical protein